MFLLPRLLLLELLYTAAATAAAVALPKEDFLPIIVGIELELKI